MAAGVFLCDWFQNNSKLFTDVYGISGNNLYWPRKRWLHFSAVPESSIDPKAKGLWWKSTLLCYVTLYPCCLYRCSDPGVEISCWWRSNSPELWTVLFAGPEFKCCLFCKHVNGNNLETLSCFRKVIYFLYMCWWDIAVIKHRRGWAALSGPCDWTIAKDLYSSICWSKLQTFSLISKHRVKMWYIVAHGMKDAYPTDEKFRRQHRAVVPVELILHECVRKWGLIGSVFRFHSACPQTTTVCVRTHFWWLLLGTAVIFGANKSI